MQVDLVFSILILIFSVIIHEVSHGYAAYLQGDNTAYYAGRLTLNPIKHLDWFGSVLLPILSYNIGGFIIGWAKPVPFNPYNLRNQKWGEAMVAFAGPLSNICLALIFGLLIRFGYPTGMISTTLATFFAAVVQINLILATFNLIPIPPLDGSKILFSILPYSMRSVQNYLERYGTIILIFFIFFLWQYLIPIVGKEFTLVTGI